MLKAYVQKYKTLIISLIIYEIIIIGMVLGSYNYLTFNNNLMLKNIVSIICILLPIATSYIYLKKKWKNFYFNQFSQWGFVIFSNLFYKYNFRANLEEIEIDTKRIEVPKQFNHFVNLNNYIIKFKKKRGKWKRKGLNVKFSKRKRIYSSKKIINYELWDYKFIYIKNKEIYFHIFLISFERISFFYLAKPPIVSIDDLIEINVKLPMHYASKVPINYTLLNKFIRYSDTILQFKENKPFLFDYSRIMSFRDIDESRLEEIDKSIRDMYIIDNLRNIDDFNTFSFLFESPILRKSKSKFEKEYYQFEIFPHERFRSTSFKFNSESTFMNELTKWYIDCFLFHQQRQDNFLRFFLYFLDWVSENFYQINHKNIKLLGSNLISLKNVMDIHNESELEFFRIISMDLRNDYLDGADNIVQNNYKKHLDLYVLLISYLDVFINRSIDYLDRRQQNLSILNELGIKELKDKLKKLDELENIKSLIMDHNAINTMNPAELRQYISFSLDRLLSENAHHQFELMCKDLAQRNIMRNIIPATGPVAGVGDQGRDFLSFKTYLDKNLNSSLLGKNPSNNTYVVFTCSLQKKVISKIKLDVEKIKKYGLPVETIYFFSREGVRVADRNKLKKWALDNHKVNLEIFDGNAIADLLVLEENHWIAKSYLKIPIT